MDESRQINVRIDEEDKAAIDQYVSEGDYESASAFIRLAIKEKLNPRLRRTRLKKELMDLLNDPNVRRELGIVFPAE